jgi:predicted DNA-binding transcriptional regulator YafY
MANCDNHSSRVVIMPEKTVVESGARVKRLLQIMLLLHEAEPRSVFGLADQFEVSRRTIFRDVELLREIGFPVTFDHKSQGYELKLEKVQQFRLLPMEVIALASPDCGPGIPKLQFLQTAREVAIAKLTSGESPLTQKQVQFVRARLADLYANADTADLDESIVEALVEAWIAESRK